MHQNNIFLDIFIFNIGTSKNQFNVFLEKKNSLKSTLKNKFNHKNKHS